MTKVKVFSAYFFDHKDSPYIDSCLNLSLLFKPLSSVPI